MVVTNSTANRSYQLPYADNDLSDDVARLIAALNAVDVDVAGLLASVAGKSEIGHSHVLADTTGLVAALASKQDGADKGIANGYAGLDATGKVPTTQLPASVLGALSYQGTWNASTNSPNIPTATSTNKGWYYKVATAGTTSISGIAEWAVGDWIVCNGTSWEKIDNTDQVLSVAGLMGAISGAGLKTALAIAKTDVSGLGVLTGFRNKLINGNFDIWQRGTSFSGAAFTADRWVSGGGGAGYAYSSARITLNPGDVPNATYGLQLTQTAGASNMYAYQKIEDVRTLAGETVTVTFWAKNAGNNPNVSIYGVQNFGSGGSANVSVSGSLVAITGSWAKYSVTLSIPSITGKTVGANNYLMLYLANGNSANTYTSILQIARVSLVAGDATGETDPFADRHIQQEIALCERYYQIGDTNQMWSGYAVSGAVNYRFAAFRTKMRTIPTITLTDRSNRVNFPATVGTAGEVSVNGFFEGRTANGTGTGYFGASHTADAEL